MLAGFILARRQPRSSRNHFIRSSFSVTAVVTITKLTGGVALVSHINSRLQLLAHLASAQSSVPGTQLVSTSYSYTPSLLPSCMLDALSHHGLLLDASSEGFPDAQC